MSPVILSNNNNNRNVEILLEGQRITVPTNTELLSLVPPERLQGPDAVLAAVYNQRVASLSYRLRSGGTLGWATFADRNGWDVYRRSACIMLYAAALRVFPGLRLVLQQTYGDGLFYEVQGLAPRERFGPEECQSLTRAMQDLRRENLPFLVYRISVDEAREHLLSRQLHDKLHLLHTHWETSVRVVVCDRYLDLFHSSVAYSTGALRSFKLVPHQDGFVFRLPVRGANRVSGRLKISRTLWAAHRTTRRWNEQVGVSNLGQLNRLAVSGGMEELIRVAEGYHEKRIAEIADQIAQAKRPPRLVLVAGPSSSGKTTFVKRLSIQLRVVGLQPVALSVDNFFVNRQRTPRDQTGEYDFECLEALDLKLFNRVLHSLLHEGSARVPRYDFQLGRAVDRKDWGLVTLGPDQVVLVEGIHALNPALTPAVANRDKLRIYISALTQLSIDDHNRIFTSDTRLLRRIVRDRRYRGYSAAETIRRWPMVRRGEMRHIFPFQDQADATFNSALIYEHSVIRNYAERTLLEVVESDPSFTEVYRLLGFLRLIVPTPPDSVPQTSLLREFIGGSGFSYQ